MDFVVTYNGKNVGKITNATSIPRVGDILTNSGIRIKVREVVWHMENGSRMWVEIVAN